MTGFILELHILWKIIHLTSPMTAWNSKNMRQENKYIRYIHFSKKIIHENTQTTTRVLTIVQWFFCDFVQDRSSSNKYLLHVVLMYKWQELSKFKLSSVGLVTENKLKIYEINVYRQNLALQNSFSFSIIYLEFQAKDSFLTWLKIY